jgi:hypothetical protein
LVSDSVCSVYKDGVEVQSGVGSGGACNVGDKLGCGVERNDDDLMFVYFTKNDERVSRVYYHSFIPLFVFPAEMNNFSLM